MINIFIKLKSIYRNIKYGILNLIRWFPIIWNDRDWDYQYLYKILYYKLKHMERYFDRENPFVANSDKYAKQIMISKNLTKRLVDNNYLNNALMWHERKFPDYLEKAFNFEPMDGLPLSKWVNKNPQNEQTSFLKCCYHSEYMENQDREYLFAHMNKYIEWWWD